MNDQQINEAIARHCGEIYQYRVVVDGAVSMQDTKDRCEEWIAHQKGSWIRGSQNRVFSLVCVYPEYCSDLNAMHGAKLKMTRLECENFNTALIDLRSPPSWAPDSPHQSLRRSWGQPARIEAEAFLRAVGKWEDGQ